MSVFVHHAKHDGHEVAEHRDDIQGCISVTRGQESEVTVRSKSVTLFSHYKTQCHIDEWWENKTIGMGFRSPWILDGFGEKGVVIKWVGWSIEDIIFL